MCLYSLFSGEQYRFERFYTCRKVLRLLVNNKYFLHLLKKRDFYVII